MPLTDIDCAEIVIEQHPRADDRWIVACCEDHDTLGRTWLSPEFAKEDMDREHGPGLAWVEDRGSWSARVGTSW